ncbi:MAG: NfeD family protein [Alphaproteobacteria bacterium]|nr:NfeD family protein [Alphaproteobacteria bacterium]
MTELLFWHWWILAGVLMVLEIVVPGVFLLWLGIAAAITGLIAYAAPMLSWQWEGLIFAIFSIIIVWSWRAYLRRHPTETELPMLNRRGEQYVGRRLTLDEPIVNGRGQVKVDDSTWRVEGADLPAGTHVKVTGVKGTILVVERAA